MFDYIVVGAGLAGSVMAERISSVLNKKVLIIEQKRHIGGHCYDYYNKDNMLIHKYGPHIFHTNSKDVWEYVNKFCDFRRYFHKVLGYIDGREVPIPFNLNSIEELFPKVMAEKLQKELTDSFEYNTKVSILDLKKTGNSLFNTLYDFVYKNVFYNYTLKQWGVLPEELDSSVVGRVPVTISYDDRYFQDRYQGMPENGYTELFQNMLSGSNIKLLLNTSFNELLKIDSSANKIYLFNEEFKGKVIFTGMIDELFDYKYGKLPYRSLNISYKTYSEEFYQEVATVNYPNNYDYTRVTEYKHLTGQNSDKTTIAMEYPEAYVTGKNNPYYPILNDENVRLYKKYLELKESFQQIYCIGRLAEYKYYNMDQVIERALEVFNKELIKYKTNKKKIKQYINTI